MEKNQPVFQPETTQEQINNKKGGKKCATKKKKKANHIKAPNGNKYVYHLIRIQHSLLVHHVQRDIQA